MKPVLRDYQAMEIIILLKKILIYFITILYEFLDVYTLSNHCHAKYNPKNI